MPAENHWEATRDETGATSYVTFTEGHWHDNRNPSKDDPQILGTMEKKKHIVHLAYLN